MRAVPREEILDHLTYSEERDRHRQDAMAAKRPRRVQLGEHLTLLFENPLTIRYQIQEMIRTEQIVREADIQHEIDTYNELLGGPGELGCTLLIGIEDPEKRDTLLRRWRALPEHLYLRMEDGERVRPMLDERQRDETRLSSVQYLKFTVGDRVPAAVGVDLPDLALETALAPEQRRALQEDLEAGEDR